MKLFKKELKQKESTYLEEPTELEKIETENIITIIALNASELDISILKNKIKIEIETEKDFLDVFDNNIITRLIFNKFKYLKLIQSETTTSSKIFLEFSVENADDYFIENLYERLNQIKRQIYNLKCYNFQQQMKKWQKKKKEKRKKKKINNMKYEELPSWIQKYLSDNHEHLVNKIEYDVHIPSIIFSLRDDNTTITYIDKYLNPNYKIELEQKLKELDIYIPHFENDFENIDCLSESLLYYFNEDDEEINTIIEYMICLLQQKIIKINKNK